MNRGIKILIAGASLLASQLFITTPDSAAAIDEVEIIPYGQPSEYEQGLQVQEEMERFGDNLPVEYGQPPEYEEEILLPEEAGQYDEGYPAEYGLPEGYEQEPMLEEELQPMDENAFNPYDQPLSEQEQVPEGMEPGSTGPAAE